MRRAVARLCVVTCGFTGASKGSRGSLRVVNRRRNLFTRLAAATCACWRHVVSPCEDGPWLDGGRLVVSRGVLGGAKDQTRSTSTVIFVGRVPAVPRPVPRPMYASHDPAKETSDETKARTSQTRRRYPPPTRPSFDPRRHHAYRAAVCAALRASSGLSCAHESAAEPARCSAEPGGGSDECWRRSCAGMFARYLRGETP